MHPQDYNAIPGRRKSPPLPHKPLPKRPISPQSIMFAVLVIAFALSAVGQYLKQQEHHHHHKAIYDEAYSY